MTQVNFKESNSTLHFKLKYFQKVNVERYKRKNNIKVKE